MSTEGNLEYMKNEIDVGTASSRSPLSALCPLSALFPTIPTHPTRPTQATVEQAGEYDHWSAERFDLGGRASLEAAVCC